MISNEVYQAITKDIAGARTKNRFIYEMYYGISRIYDLYCSREEFFTIFDYACDFEEGVHNLINFYQLKTKNKNYTLKNILSRKGNKSILQTLVDLRSSEFVNNLFVVSNASFSGLCEKNKKFSNMETFCFDELEDEDKTKIIQSINWPNNTSFLKNIYFIKSDLCLNKVSISLLGYTEEFLEKIYPGTPSLSKFFMRAIVNLVMEKASYEQDTYTLEETINKKGVTKENIELLLKEYYDNLINSRSLEIDDVKSKTKELGLNFKLKLEIEADYINLFTCGYVNEDIKVMSKAIKNYALTIVDSSMTENDVIFYVVEHYNDFGIYSSLSTRYLLTIYALK